MVIYRLLQNHLKISRLYYTSAIYVFYLSSAIFLQGDVMYYLFVASKERDLRLNR